MAEQLQPIVYRGMSRGMVDETVTADSLMPNTQFRLQLNMDTDIIGTPKRRNGYSQLGTLQVSGASVSLLGLFQHVSTTSANSELVSFANNSGGTTAEAYYLNGSNVWTNKALGFTINTKIRTVTFLDYLFAVNGTDAPKSWTGATGASWGTTNLTSAPTGALIETYRQQIYIGSESTDQVNFSSIPSAGAVTWSASDNFILNPNDGTHLSALKRYGTELILHKTGKAGSFMYRYNAHSTDPDPIIGYGAASQEAVANTAGVHWFYDAYHHNAYGYSGGYPQLISKPVRSWFKAVPTSSQSAVCTSYDDDHVEWFLGNVTVSNIPFTNVSARYTISTQSWCVRSYANAFKIFSSYDDGTTQYMLGGTSTGYVAKMETGNDDMGTTVQFQLETAWLTIGANPAVLFKLSSFAAFVDNAASLTVQYKTDLDQTWRPIGNCRQFVNSWSGINAEFHRIKFRFVGISDADPTVFEGFSILAPMIEAVDDKSETDEN